MSDRRRMGGAPLPVASLLLSTVLAAAQPPLPTIDQVLDICRSSTLREATRKGDALGWPRAAGDKEWEAAFVRANGGSVEVVGWRRSEAEAGIGLSFRVARGPAAHRACSYSVSDPDAFLRALIERLGEPGTLEKFEFGSQAYWQHGTEDIAFSQVGSSALLQVARKD